MKSKELDLHQALAVFLYDQCDCPDVFESVGDEERLIGHIIYALIEKNGKICPFKNYSCLGSCKKADESCEIGLEIDCDREFEDIWKGFIFTEESEENNE